MVGIEVAAGSEFVAGIVIGADTRTEAGIRIELEIE